MTSLGLGGFPLVSLVIPVFNEEQNLPFVRGAVSELRERLSLKGCRLEVVLTDNHSTDASWVLIERWASEEDGVRAFRLTRNYGFQASLVFGMREATGDCLVILQSDLQDPPELVDVMVDSWLTGSRVVAARAVSRAEGVGINSIRRFYYVILQQASDKALLRGVQDFYLLDKSVYPDVSSSGFTHQFLRGKIVGLFGVDTVIDYERVARKRGVSSYGLSTYYRIGMDGLLLYGARLIRAGAVLAVVFAVLSVLGLVGLLSAMVLGWRPAAAGWASVILFQLLLFAGLGLALAVVLEYLVRIYEVAVSPADPHVQMSVGTPPLRPIDPRA